MPLTAGYHDITIAFYQGNGGEGIEAGFGLAGNGNTDGTPFNFSSFVYGSAKINYGNNVTVSNGVGTVSTIDTANSVATMGSLAIDPNSPLTVTSSGTVRFAGGTTFTNAGGGTSYTIGGTAAGDQLDLGRYTASGSVANVTVNGPAQFNSMTAPRRGLSERGFVLYCQQRHAAGSW